MSPVDAGVMMQLLRMGWDTVHGQVRGGGNGKLTKRAAEPQSHDFVLQKLAQADAEVITVRDDVCDAVANRDVQRNFRVRRTEVGSDRLHVIDIGYAWSDDAERS